MDGLIIRVDDVSENTNHYDLEKSCEFLNREIGAKIIWCINLYSKRANGSVYPDLPLKDKSLEYLCDVDQGYVRTRPSWIDVASHGLIHAKHGELSRDAQLISIKTSCSMLRTYKFAPPFMSYNEDTKDICFQNGIELIDGIGWKSMESEPLDKDHRLWYFHQWRMDYRRVVDWVHGSQVVA